jgi:thioredoxin 1
MMSTLPAVTDATFDAEVLQGDKPVLVDFWAEWCGPCRMMTPVVEQFAAQQAGKLQVLAMDIQENMETPAKLGIMNIPTMILFVGGQEKERLVGPMPLARLAERVTRHLC